MTARVMLEMTLTLLILSRATTMPRGSANSSVRKNIAQVPPMPSSIVLSIVIRSIDILTLNARIPEGASRLREACGFFIYALITC